MKIALISTDADLWGFGVRILSAGLRAAGHTTQLLLLPSESPQYLSPVLEEIEAQTSTADLVGISCFSRGATRARQVAIRLQQRGKPVIWGGLHASLNPEDCSRSADMVCRGEGEETILEVADFLQRGQDWRHIRNLAYTANGRFSMNPLRPPVADLNQLPVPDFHNFEEFHLNRKLILESVNPANPRAAAQALSIGSRGCAFHCTYCCNRQIKDLYAGNGRYIRKMSPAKYVEQIETLHKHSLRNATDFFLVDEDFFMRTPDELREFSALYKQRIGIPFECMASPPRVTEEKLACLTEAGLWRIRIGIESGSERTKRVTFERPISNAAVLQASSVINRHRNVVPAYFLINGNPYEQQEDLLETLRLMAQLPFPYYAQVFSLVFFPGSSLYQKAVADGVINGVEDSGAELHYRDGFQYRQHAWKKKNLYLNVLIFLMEGKASKHRLGLLPRFLLPFLIRPGVIRMVEAKPFVSRWLVAVKTAILSVRRIGGALLKRIMADPAGVYDVPRYMRNLIARAFS